VALWLKTLRPVQSASEFGRCRNCGGTHIPTRCATGTHDWEKKVMKRQTTRHLGSLKRTNTKIFHGDFKRNILEQKWSGTSCSFREKMCFEVMQRQNTKKANAWSLWRTWNRKIMKWYVFEHLSKALLSEKDAHKCIKAHTHNNSNTWSF